MSSSDVLHFLAFSELPVVLWGNVLVTMVISETSSFTRIIFKYLALPLCDVFKHSLCRHLLDRNILKHAAEYEVTKQLEHFVSENRKYVKKIKNKNLFQSLKQQRSILCTAAAFSTFECCSKHDHQRSNLTDFPHHSCRFCKYSEMKSSYSNQPPSVGVTCHCCGETAQIGNGSDSELAWPPGGSTAFCIDTFWNGSIYVVCCTPHTDLHILSRVTLWF